MYFKVHHDLEYLFTKYPIFTKNKIQNLHNSILNAL